MKTNQKVIDYFWNDYNEKEAQEKFGSEEIIGRHLLGVKFSDDDYKIIANFDTPKEGQETEFLLRFSFDLTREQMINLINLVIAKEDYNDRKIYSLLYFSVFNSDFKDDEEITSLYWKYLENAAPNIKDDTISFVTTDNNDIEMKSRKDSLEEKRSTVTKPTSAIKTYTKDLTSVNYPTNPAVGREREIKELEIALVYNSAMILGKSGVGKTALVEELAYRIQKGEVPKYLQNKKILKTSATELISGCKFVGMVEENTKGLFDELASRDDVILFLDEIHTVIGAGKGTGTNDVANIIKPYIDRADVKIIGATTEEEYKNFEKDPAFKRRFDKITIKEPEGKILDKIIRQSYKKYSNLIGVKFRYNESEINKINHELIRLTNSKNRDYREDSANPDICDSIIRKAFSYAAFYEHKYLELGDIRAAINSCEYIYETHRQIAMDNISKIRRLSPKEQNKVLVLKRGNLKNN